jgi:predicted metal-binding membrane protein
MDRRPIALQQAVLLALLILVAAACWAWLLAMDRAAGAMDMAAMARPTMGMGWVLFLTVWVVMMAAMMFPAAAPMIVTFHKVQAARRRSGQAFVSTWVFVAGYMLVWTLAGVVAYLAALAGEAVAAHAGMSAETAARIGGAILVAAGVYQLTPLKDACLATCRTPVGFIMTSWRDGAIGALRMGMAHGLWCLGCCWLLFAILFPLGMMNIGAMAVLAVIVYAEKALPWGQAVVRATAAGLVAYGVFILAVPSALPTYPGAMGGAMQAGGQGAMPGDGAVAAGR